MATWMNECEVDQILSVTRTEAPAYFPFAKLLSDWRDTVNENSDGWAHYAGGTRCAAKLMEGLEQVRVAYCYGRDRRNLPTPADLKKALGPIKARATKLGWPQPVLREGR